MTAPGPPALISVISLYRRQCQLRTRLRDILPQTQTRPRNGRRRRQTDQAEDGKVTLELLLVAPKRAAGQNLASSTQRHGRKLTSAGGAACPHHGYRP